MQVNLVSLRDKYRGQEHTSHHLPHGSTQEISYASPSLFMCPLSILQQALSYLCQAFHRYIKQYRLSITAYIIKPKGFKTLIHFAASAVYFQVPPALSLEFCSLDEMWGLFLAVPRKCVSGFNSEVGGKQRFPGLRWRVKKIIQHSRHFRYWVIC